MTEWTQAAEITGSGTVTIDLDPGRYWFRVDTESGKRSNLVACDVTSQGHVSTELKTYFQTRMRDDATLVAKLASADAIEHAEPSVNTLSRVVFLLRVAPVNQPRWPSHRYLLQRLELCILAPDRSGLDGIAADLRRLFEGHVFDTTLWTCHQCEEEEMPHTVDQPLKIGTGTPFLMRHIRFALRMSRK